MGFEGRRMKFAELNPCEPVIVEAVRTGVGKRGGALRNWHAANLLSQTLSEVVSRANVPLGDVDDVVAGCATQVGEQAGNIARTAALLAGMPFKVPGTTIQRACGSSQQAIHMADNLIRSGVCDVVIACGVEMMSKTQGGNEDTRFGRRYPEEMLERFSMPSMGQAAERIAKKWNLSRSWLDELACRSHQLAAAAQAAGRFSSQIMPVASEDGSLLIVDEGVRPSSNLEKLATLKTAFQEDGVVTAGNASQISDGAAALLLMTAAKAREYGLRPRARLKAQRVVGVDPEIMLTGPIPATIEILQRSGLSLADIDLFEVNEAFSSVLGAWLCDIGASLDRVNVNGGAIAMGHPLGSSGARLATILLNELESRGARYGLQTMCCGGGMGTATVFELIE
jgi:acetyl-CoA acyltransferase